ncbi:MAG TPA: L-threonylcarbamoyladenylate synthase [Rhodopila sp.]|uniref:L-threonylcarbamoyladenylate synthase n=1 Tax=Rhodopila sp. TaxID=2480087 RepID=UPI002B77136C|nr:L-threonylcarbamoyladenylate synthase [Rhodopila sp.]HVY13660.1 L-threonylcarbamoyladenylate synthase [Rhodopila sp.]
MSGAGPTEMLRPDGMGLARAAALLRAGRLVAFGTETVYGLGGDATNPEAVAGIYEAKGRPRFNPLISHYPTAEAAFRDVRAGELARKLAEAFWPGPLTLVLRRAAACPVSLLASAGLETLAVRVPSHPVARALLAEAGIAVVAPSANRSGGISPTTAAHVMAELEGRIAAVLDSGRSAVGLESTVLDLSSETPVLLRPGGVALEELERLIGPVGRISAAGIPTGPGQHPGLRSPGLLLSHYAPTLPVRVNVTEVAPNEMLLAFGPPLDGALTVYQLSETGDLRQAAARLFEGLRWLDGVGLRQGARGIAVMTVPAEGLGLAINDRLIRAAAPRGKAE